MSSLPPIPHDNRRSVLTRNLFDIAAMIERDELSGVMVLTLHTAGDTGTAYLWPENAEGVSTLAICFADAVTSMTQEDEEEKP